MNAPFTCPGPLERATGWIPPVGTADPVAACYWHTADVVQGITFAFVCVIVVAMLAIAVRRP